MSEDDITRQIRATRDAFAARFNYDVDAMGRYLREKAEASGRQLVYPPPMPVQPDSELPQADRRQAG